VIGAAEPTADVELLVMADQLLKELGIADGVTCSSTRWAMARAARHGARR
jgi:histidyl-tRNA synthetase